MLKQVIILAAIFFAAQAVAGGPGKNYTGIPFSTESDLNRSRVKTFTKLSETGLRVSETEKSWSCVQDNSTGLIWEVKDAGMGLRSKWHTYTWYNPDEKSNGGVEGREGDVDDVTCGNPVAVKGGCDTEKYVAAVNASGLCGYNDWRMPSVDELSSLIDYSRSLPAIQQDFFPDIVMPAGFWTSSPSAAGPSYAWIVIFDDGYLGTCVKSWNYYLRLVRDNNRTGGEMK